MAWTLQIVDCTIYVNSPCEIWSLLHPTMPNKKQTRLLTSLKHAQTRKVMAAPIATFVAANQRSNTLL